MFKHFLLLFDGSPLAEGVLHHTIAFARLFWAQVTLYYSAGTQWPYARVITNFIAYGTTPLLVVQARSPLRTSPLTADTPHWAESQLSIAFKQLSTTWRYD